MRGLALLLVLAAVAQAELLLTYGPPSDFQPTGFGMFNPSDQTFRGDGTALGARLLAPPRVTGVLAGTAYTIVYGAFNWVRGEGTYNILVLDSASGATVPLWPGVWGAGVEGACWRNERMGTFFVVGQILGFQNSPQSRVKGVSLCSVDLGCGAVRNGLRELPLSMQFASIAYDERSNTLFVMYLAIPSQGLSSAPETLLATYSEEFGWTYRSIFSPFPLGGLYAPRLVKFGLSVWINLDPVLAGTHLGSLFCPQVNTDPIPPLIGYAPAQCWSLPPPGTFTNMTTPTDYAQAAGMQDSLVAVTRLQSSGLLVCRRIFMPAGGGLSQFADCTFNLNALAQGRTVSHFSSSTQVYATLLGASGQVVDVAALSVEQHTWSVVHRIVESNCINYPNGKDYGSPFASQSPVAASSDGLRLVYTCPFPSSSSALPEAAFTVHSYDLAANLTVILARRVDVYRAARIDDMCVAGDTVFVRGNFLGAHPTRGDSVATPQGLATWLPGSATWRAAPAAAGQFEAGAQLMRCTVGGSFLWIPFLAGGNASTMSLAYYSCVSGVWFFAAPGFELPRPLEAQLSQEGGGGHSQAALAPDGRALFMTWRMRTHGLSHVGVLMRLDLPPAVNSEADLADLTWRGVAVLLGCARGCFAFSFSNTVWFGGSVWVTGSFRLLPAADVMADGVARFDAETGAALPVDTSPDELLTVSSAAVGSFSAGAPVRLWLGGSIKTVPSIGDVKNVVALDERGNFTSSTRDLLSPPQNLECSALFFSQDVMITISHDGREGYGEYSAGMNIFANGPATYPDPNVQQLFFDVQVAASVEVFVSSQPVFVAIVLVLSILIIAAVSIVIPWLWLRFQNSGAFRYIVLPDYASHGFNTNLGQLLADEDVLKLDPEEVVLGVPIGQGGQGLVRRATYRGKDIACKALFGFDAKTFSSFVREIKLTSLISHPNVLNFVGVVLQDDVLWACSELMDTDLRKVMAQLSAEARLQVALDVAAGMAYLHSFQPPIVHMDLKPSNVLISRSGAVKIADFGVSRLAQEKRDDAQQQLEPAGTLIYMAPESFERGAPIGPKGDVYAYGLVVLEVYGVSPYGDAAALHFYQFTELVKTGSLRPNVGALGPEAPACVHTVVRAALAFDPSDRPMFAQILKTLKQ